MNNSTSVRGYLWDNLFHIVMGVVWYKNILMKCLNGMSYNQSRTILIVMIATMSAIGMRENYFLECNQYSGEWYGTPIHVVQSCVNKGKIAVIEIDSNGFRQIMGASLARKYRVLSVFIVADADTIIKRLLNRNTENLEKTLLRSNSSLDECEWIVYYDLILPNYDLDESVTIFEKAILTGAIPKMTFNVEEYKHRMKHLIYLLSD